MITQNIQMEMSSGPQNLGMEVVVALNVVDLDDYVKKEDLEKMHVMTWGNELPQEGEANA